MSIIIDFFFPRHESTAIGNRHSWLWFLLNFVGFLRKQFLGRRR